MLSGKLKAAWSETAPPSSSVTLKFDTSKGTAGTTVGVNLGGTVNVVIDWGDGTPPQTVTTAGYATHTYATGGIYGVSISGSLTQLGDSVTTAYQDKLVECVSFGDGMGLTSLASAFRSASNLLAVPTSIPSTVTDVNRMFEGATSFNGDISSWDTSAVTNMAVMFLNATSFNQDISSWDTVAVTGMNQMFSGAAAFNQDLSSWCVGNIQSPPSAFDTGATSYVLPRPVWGTCPLYYTTGTVDLIGSASGVIDTAPFGLPAHVAGDVILCWAFRDGSATTPSTVAGWTTIGTRIGTTLCAARLSYIVAVDSATLPGTWTGATSVVFVIYRGIANPAELVNFDLYQAGSVASVTYPANAYWSGLSKVVSFAGHRSGNTNLQIPPAGLDFIVGTADATDESAAFNSSSSTYAAWPSTNVAVAGTTSNWITAVLRLRPPIAK